MRVSKGLAGLVIFIGVACLLALVLNNTFRFWRQEPDSDDLQDKVQPLYMSREMPAQEIPVNLFFQCLEAEVDQPVDEALVPVTRYIPKTEAVARTVFYELMSGPLPCEVEQYQVGPVFCENITLEDIYITQGICVLHLAGELDFNAREEKLLYYSLVYSLCDLSNIDSVWLFLNNSPWQPDDGEWCSPVAPPGEKMQFTLYYRDMAPGTGLIKPAVVELETPLGQGREAQCPFKTIIIMLTTDLDRSRGAALPDNNYAAGISLEGGCLTIDLAGKVPGNIRETQVLLHSLVFTFTGLPEIDEVMITHEGEVWKSGSVVVKQPLRPEDF